MEESPAKAGDSPLFYGEFLHKISTVSTGRHCKAPYALTAVIGEKH